MTDEHSVRKILNVFIASPGDVNPEREAARKVVDKINRIFSQSLGWQIELKGWEDLSPGTGRPQALINKDVDSCTLFLGVLWKRWGSPTGVYSSGFEEEFERARERYKKTRNPTIWLCFKQVDKDFLQDPGQQLIKVREFCEAQKNAREFLFQEFKDLEDWKEKLEEWLSKHILELHKSSLQKDNDEIDEQISLPQADQSSLLSISKEQNKLESSDQKQLLYLISRISKIVKNPKENEDLNSFEIARLSLFSKTLLQRRYSDEFLSNHEINLLYQSKNQLNPTSEELFQLLRTIINDKHDLKAAWYWLKNERKEDIAANLHLIAERDGTIALREQAIEFLKKAGVCLTSDPSERSEIRTSILTDNSEKIRAAWLSYLGSTGSLEDLNIVESASSDDDPSVQAAAKSAKFLILARHEPTNALKEILDNDVIVSSPIIKEIEKQTVSLEDV